MQHKLTKWTTSCYDIELVVTTEDNETAKQKILKNFQKDLDLPGFRKWHAPMDKVEENIKPEYLTIGIYENIINHGLQEIVKENPTIKFIGEPYGINQKKEGENTVITLKLDIFPEVEVINDDWKKHSMKKIEHKVSKEEIDEAVVRLKKNYADYKEAEIVSEDTISKIALSYLDKDDNEVDKWHTYVGEPEFMEFDFFKKEFLGKKKGESFEIKYDTKKIPEVLLTKKTGIEVAKLRFTLQDVKQIILPEINEEMLEKLFWKDSTVKNEKDLLAFIENSIAENAFDTQLMKQVEDVLTAVRGKNLKVDVPVTLVEEEFKSRVANLEKKFGTKERVEQYLAQIGEEKTKEFMADIQKAAQESLEKFFILQKLVHLLELEVDREKPGHLEIEKKIYDKLVK